VRARGTLESARWQYKVIGKEIHRLERGRCFTYALAAMEKTADRWRTVEIIEDVTPGKELACWMAAVFTKHQLSPLHFRDAVEDVLGCPDFTHGFDS